MYKTILFDFDGTLIDTHLVIVQGLSRLSQKTRGIPLLEFEYAQILGKPLTTQIQMLFGDENDLEDFQQWYAKNHDTYATGYENIEDMLQMLQAEGYQLGIVTNNSWRGLELGLDFLNIRSYFDCIITLDDVTEPKPSPEGILKALAQLNSSPDECLFVGDSANDIHAARAAGVLPVLVSWTSLSLEEIRRLAPAELIESPYEIPFLLNLLNTEIA